MGRKKETPVMDMQRLSDLAKELDDIGEEAFSRKYPHPFLVLLNAPENASNYIDPGTIETLNGSKDDKDRAEDPISLAIGLKKAGRNMYESRVTVGRARNNDIVIRSPKVSKLHAAFDRAEDGKSFEMIDMGSVNGTRINAVRLDAKQAVPLSSGDKIAFWRYEFEYMILDSFMVLLRNEV